MKSPYQSITVASLLLVLGTMAPSSVYAQSITVERHQFFFQTDASTLTPRFKPVSFRFNIRGSNEHSMHAWGPAFYKPGTSQTPESAASPDTNTGTLNFSATPNNVGRDYMFIHDLSTIAELDATYPLGAYGVLFNGSGAPSPASFTAALDYEGGTYPSVIPQLTSLTNGATWSGGMLILNPTGTTTLHLNTFPEYSSTLYGSYIGAAVYDGALNQASAQSYHLPTLDSSDPAVTQIAIDGTWLEPARAYTMEIQYGVIGAPPEGAVLDAPHDTTGQIDHLDFQGLASYGKRTLIQVMVPAQPPAIDSHPSSQSVQPQATATFSVEASGGALSYQWRRNGVALSNSSRITGVTGISLSISDVQASDLGDYTVVVTNSAGTVTSNVAALTITPPSFTTQPSSQSVASGGIATFSVGLSRTDNYSYYWQVSAPGTGSWIDVSDSTTYSGSRSATLEVAADSAMSGSYYRCVVFYSGGHVVSNSAIMTVTAPAAPTITSQPSSMIVASGATVAFSIGAAGTAPFTYYWQMSAPGTGFWSELNDNANYSGTRTPSLGVTATAGMHGTHFRCVVYNSLGHAVSNSAILSVPGSTPPTVTSQPASAAVAPGNNASFALGVSGTAPFTYYWQMSAPGTGFWSELNDNANYSGTRTPSLGVTATAGIHGTYFRCVVYNSLGHAVSNSAILSVEGSTPPTVTSQPASATVASGSNASFTVGVSGSAPFTYYWQVSMPGTGFWSELSDNATTSGAHSATLTVAASAGVNGAYYRCVIYNSVGHRVSDSAILSVP